MDAAEIERALRAIVPTTSPSQLMESVVEHTIAASRSDPHRKRRRASRRHGAYVRLRELEQSRQYNLQLDTIDLKRQIAELAQLRQMLAARTLNRSDAGDGSFVQIASVYYACMGRGYRDVVVLDDARRRIDTKAYLQTAMADDVMIGRFCGRQNFLPMMKRYSTYFAGNNLRLTSATVLPMEGENQVIVRTTGDYSAWITEHAIRQIFPHVLDHAKLVHTLQSRPLQGSSTFDFVFDCATHRIVRFDADMNFLPAFMNLIPDPTVLAFLFSQAKISEEMFIGELDEFDSTRTPPSSPSVVYVDDEDDEDTASTMTPSPRPSASTPITPMTTPTLKPAEPEDAYSPSRGLKMRDLLSPEGDAAEIENSRRPSVY